MTSTPHSEPCPVCLRDDAWEIEYDFTEGDELAQVRCQNCGWPPPTPHTVEQWRRQHFISPYLKDLEAMVADRDERIRSLEEQLQTAQTRLAWYEGLQGEANDADFASMQSDVEYHGLKEQLETLRTNAIRRFQVIYNETDPDRMRLLAYDGIAETTGNEWRDLTASSPAKRPTWSA